MHNQSDEQHTLKSNDQMDEHENTEKATSLPSVVQFSHFQAVWRAEAKYTLQGTSCLWRFIHWKDNSEGILSWFLQWKGTLEDALSYCLGQ